MLVMRYSSLLLVGLVVFAGAGAMAQTQAALEVERNRLARMEQSLENRTVEVEDIENELLSFDYKLERAQESLKEARANYQESRRELHRAEQDHKQGATSDTGRKLNLARHAFAMAERGVDSRGRRVEFIRSNYDELKAQLATARRAVSRGEASIADQRESVERMTNRVLARADAERRAAAPVAKPQLPKPSVASLKVVPGEAAAEAAPETQREVEAELLDYVKRERTRLDKLLADESGDGKHSFRSLSLKPNRGETLPFEFLGHNQYRLVAPVEAGRQTYRVNNWKFRRTIPADDNGERYVFIFDARRLSRPRLVMYPEYVLSYLD